MKKIGTAMALLLISVLMLFTAACSGESKDNVNPVGTWILVVESSGSDFQKAELYKPVVESMNAVIEIKDGGTVTISANIGGSDTKQEGSWKYVDGVLTLKDPTGATTAGSGSTTFTYKDGKFVPETGYICLVRK